MKISLEDIFSISTAVIYEPDKYKSVSSVSTDTRAIKKNSLFVALKGKNFDGHNYINEAVKKGATAVVVQHRKVKDLDNINIPIISVQNTLLAYGELARIWRNKHSAKIISITGSNGKTTTKEIIAHLLSSKYKVHKTIANNNNQIGVPLTILTAPNDADFIVLEHGTNHFGEIEYTAKIAQPNYAVITNIGNSHTQYLESKEKVLIEKSELFKQVKENGTIFINNDDLLLRKLKIKNVDKISFATKGNSDIKGTLISTNQDATHLIEINGLNKKLKVSLPLLGESNVKNYLTAVSIALKLGVSSKEIEKATKTLVPVKGRLQKKEFKKFTIIDDTYNANPESVNSALNVLGNFNLRSEKVLILGDMFELGKDSEKLHKDLVDKISKIKNINVFTIGKATKQISNEIKKAKTNIHFAQRKNLIKYFSNYDLNNSVILVKGSRGMKMEEFVQTLEKRSA